MTSCPRGNPHPQQRLPAVSHSECHAHLQGQATCRQRVKLRSEWQICGSHISPIYPHTRGSLPNVMMSHPNTIPTIYPEHHSHCQSAEGFMIVITSRWETWGNHLSFPLSNFTAHSHLWSSWYSQSHVLCEYSLLVQGVWGKNAGKDKSVAGQWTQFYSDFLIL